MLIGLISDSHGNSSALRRAADFFSKRANIIIHCGDVTAPEHLDVLLAGGITVHLVRGNCDRDLMGFKRAAYNHNLIYHERAGWLELDGVKIGFAHGDSSAIFYSLLNRRPDYLIQGHSHERTDNKIDGTRIINPGAAGSSVALLNTESGNLEFHDLNDQH